MLKENQKIEMEWTNNIKKIYIDKGYQYTKLYDIFYVDVKDLSPGSKKKVNVVCDMCGIEYNVTYGVYTHNKKPLGMDLCVRCARKAERMLDKRKRAIEEFEKIYETANEFGYEVISLPDEYTDCHTKIKYICPKHGVKEASVSNFLNKRLCTECGRDRTTEVQKLSLDEVERRINVHGNMLLNKNDYINIMTPNLHIRCSCGNEWTTSLAAYNNSKKMCRKCSRKESSGELCVRKILEKYNVVFIPQYSFKDLIDIRYLSFDFFLPDYNCCIEFDGQGHYENVWDEKSFERAKKHDKMKNDYCATNNIKLIRIPYWDARNTEDILKNELHLTDNIYETKKSHIKIRAIHVTN